MGETPVVTVVSGSVPSWAKGYVYGDGYGYVYGDGYGYGYGYGYGDGYGDGSGEGYGDGSGEGYGDGSGEGYGYGYGDGYGYGYGEGYGDGLKECLPGFLKALPAEQKTRAKELKRAGAIIAYWRSSQDGTPANGGSAEAARPGLVQEVKGPLEICTSRALHATYNPPKWKGERIWLVALIGKVVEQEDKLAALKREIIAEITPK